MEQTERKVSRVERLVVAYAEWCERWSAVLDRRLAFGDQIRRAASSIMSNVGEAFDADTLAEKRRYFGYALASTGESIRLLRTARRTGALPDPAVVDALRTLRDIKWDLIRLIRWTRR